MDVIALLAGRAEKDAFLKESYASPLPEEEIETFTGLDYFPPDPTWWFRVRFEPAGGAMTIESTSGSRADYAVVGHVEVPLPSGPVRLTVLDGGDGDWFIPFRDATCGVETYGGGRYVPVVPDGDGMAVVDFNRAHNPYCVYDPDFSCPLPPPGNTLAVPVEAGEKMYRGS